MRHIVVLKLDNDTNINVIANVQKPEEARSLAVKHFDRLIGDKNYQITNKSKIISSEKWEQSRISSLKNGDKLYKVAFYFNDITQSIIVSAVSVKSAYNNIITKFGLDENLFMIIYDTTQSVRKKSAVRSAGEIWRDSSKLKELLIRTAKKSKDIEELESITDDIKLLLLMIGDIHKGKYELPRNLTLSTIASLIYFNEPYTTSQDIINTQETLSDITIMKMLITGFKNQLTSYDEAKSSK